MASNHYGDGKNEPIINASFTGGSKPIDLNDSNVLNPDATAGLIVSGDINEAIKSTIVGGRDVIGGGSRGLDPTHTLGNDTIVGDAVNLTATTFTGGADKITLQGMHDVNATVIGDAVTTTGGSTRGGNDTIIVTDAINGGTIIGDVEEVTNTTFIAGNDNIQLKNDVTGANIYTDAKNYNSANTLSGGNDIVTLGIKNQANTVANSTINLGHGTNTLTAYSTLDDTTVAGGAGVDRFIITQMTNASSLNGDAGNDVINVATVNEGDIDGGVGNDNITVTAANNASVKGGSGNDTITITNATGNLNDQGIMGEDGNDSVNITQSLLGYAGDDTAFIADNTLRVTMLDSGAGNDIIKLNIVNNGAAVSGGADNDKISAKEVSLSDIDGGAGNDSFTITNVNSGSIDGGAGDDTHVITTMHGGTASGGDDDDSIRITKLAIAKVQGNDGDDSITITTMGDKSLTGRGAVYGNDGNDTIIITTMNLDSRGSGGTVFGDDYDDSLPGGDDSIKITTFDGSIYGGNGNDTITITTSHGYIQGDDGDDSINIINLYDGSYIYGNHENDTINITNMYGGRLSSGAGNDSMSIGTMYNGDVYDTEENGGGNDTLIINRYTAGDINLRGGDDYLKITSKYKSAVSDDTFVTALGAGDDTLEVGWAFNGTFTSSQTNGADDNDTLITKGLGEKAYLDFGDGNDFLNMLSSSNKSQHQGDTALVTSLGAGQDTLQVNWAFNGAFDTSDNDGGTLITKGLNANSTLQFGTGNDGLEVIGALTNRQIKTLHGDDTVSMSGSATNVQVDLGTGSDVFSVGAMGRASTLTYDTDGHDNITIKGTYNDDMVFADGGEAAGGFDGISTGTDGGSITLDTLGTGKLEFGASNDSITINKNVAGTATVKKEISTLAGDDSIDLKGAVTNAIVDADTGADTVSIGALSTGSTFKYNADDTDNITVKGTYNAGFAQTTVGADTFYGLATGADGGSITLDTVGTGKLQFGDGTDSLTINKALSGTFGLKDIFMQAGDDNVTLNTVNGAVISGGAGSDYISATGLGATGVLNGDIDTDSIQIGRIYGDANDLKSTAIMNNGVIDGGADDDTIVIGNALIITDDISEIKGTFSGGKVYGGDGNDDIITGTLSGTALMDGGDGDDTFTVTNMSGGTISGGDGNDTINISGTFSRGTINGDDGGDLVNITTMSGGTINGGNDADIIDITNLRGGIINGDAGADTIKVTNAVAGTVRINNTGSEQDTLSLTDGLTKGGNVILSGDAGFMVTNVDDTDPDNLVHTGFNVSTGALTGSAGADNIVIASMDSGTINAGQGNNLITIKDALNGGSIITGAGNDTLILSDGVTLSGKYTINLGAGDNEIQIASNLDGQEFILGTTNDYVNLTALVSDAKINLGNGNDSIRGSHINNTIIDAGSGDDSINMSSFRSESIIYGGIGNDTIATLNSIDAVIDLGTGNNILTVTNQVSNTVITGGSGGDSVSLNGTFTGDSYIALGTGNDSLHITKNTGSMDDTDFFTALGTGNDTLSVGWAFDGTFDAGTDGGTLKATDLGTNANVSFGKGHDGLYLTSATPSAKAQEAIDNLLSTAGNDTLSVGWAFDGEFNAGTDGGTLIAAGLGAGANVTFGNGNDGLVLGGANSLSEAIDLKTGNDSITINTADAGTITYNSIGFDSITIDDVYSGNNIYGYTTDRSGNEITDNKLTTGTDGGFIHVGSLGVNGAAGLDFGTGNDHFSIDTMNVDATIDLEAGNDTITVTTSLTAGTLRGGAGTNTYTIEEIAGGNVLGGTGVDKFDIGTMSAGTAKGDAGNDIFSISTLSGTVSGLDTITGLINGEAGNDSISIDTLNAHGEVYGDAGNDIFTITTMNDGKVDGGTGINTYNMGTLAGGEVLGNTGVDKFNIDTMSNGTVNGEAGNDSIVVTNISGGAIINTGDGNDRLTANEMDDGFIRGGQGKDTFTITTMSDGTVGGDADNDTFDIESMNGGEVRGNAGNDTFDIEILSGSAEVIGSDDNDTFIIDTMNDGLVRGDAGNDIFDIKTLSASAEVMGGDNNDKITITTITGGTLYGDDTTNVFKGNDTITVTTATGGTIVGGEAIETQNARGVSIFGVDSIVVKNTTDLTIYGDYADGTAEKTDTENEISYNDIIKVTGIAQSTDIYGNYGADNIIVATMNGGSINGGTGNDTITITTGMGDEVDGGFSLDGGAGTDTITITTLNRGVVEGGINTDSITIKNAYASSIYGDENGGSDTTAYNDIIKVTGLAEDTDIYGGYGGDAITVGSATAGSNIYGNAGNDTIRVTTLTDSSIDGGAGLDEIYVSNQLKSEVTFSNDDNDAGTTDTDKILLTGGIGAGADITLSGTDGFDVAKSYNANTGLYTGFNMSGGTLNGSDGTDDIHLATFSGGSINIGDGADKLNITTFSGGSINTGDGADTITVTNAMNKTVNIANGADTIDTLYLTTGISAGANIILEGDGGFNVAKNAAGDGIAMTGGTLTGSEGADTFTILLSGNSKGILAGGQGADKFYIDATKVSSITIDDFTTGDTIFIGDNTTAITAADVVGKDSITGISSNGHEITIYLNTVYVDPNVEPALTNITNKTIYGTLDEDSISISGTATNSKIFALAGNDTITVGTLTNSEIYGEADADDITITTVNGGRIDGGAAADTVTITTQVKKAITIANSGSEQDSLYLTGGIGAGGNISLEGAGFVVAKNASNEGFNLASGTLTGSDGADTFHIDNMSSGTLSGGASADNFTLATLIGGTVNGDAGNDDITVTTMSNGIINGGADADNINITTMTGGTVDGGAGADTTTIANDINKVIRINNTGVENDTVYLEGGIITGGNVILTSNAGFVLAKNSTTGLNMAAGTITGSTGSDNIHIATLTSGTINTNAGDDNISVENMTAGTINTGVGADDITISTMSAGTLDGGVGVDTISITDAISSKIVIKNTGTEQDILNLNGGIIDNAEITLTSSAGFAVTSTMSGGKLTASAGVDNITLSAMNGGSLLAGSGNDNITITTMTDGSIEAGDGNDLVSVDAINGSINGGNGVDTLHVRTEVTTNTNIGGGTNFESFSFESMSTGSIVGTEKADNIAVTTMSGGALNGNAGNDVLTVENMIAGSIDGGAGTDTIHINNEIVADLTITNTGTERDELNLNGGIGSNTTVDPATVGNVTLTSAEGSFNVNVASLNDGARLNGSAGADRINIENMLLGIIDGKDGADTITLMDVGKATINNEGAEADIIFLSNALDYGSILTLTGTQGNVVAKSAGSRGTYNGFDMNGGTINGSDNAETIYVNTLSAGTINTNAGDDSIIINNLIINEIAIENTTGSDKLSFVGGVGNGATINLTTTGDGFIVGGASNSQGFTMSGGTINGSDVADEFNLWNMSNGTINAGAGNDTINIYNILSGGIVNAGSGDDYMTIFNSMTGGKIELGSGSDRLNFNKIVNQEIRIGNDEDNAHLSFNSGIGANSHIILSGDGHFNLYGQNENSFNFTGGILQGSESGTFDAYIKGVTANGGSIDAGKQGDIYITDTLTKKLEITGDDVTVHFDGDTDVNIAAGANLSFGSDGDKLTIQAISSSNYHNDGIVMTGGKITTNSAATIHMNKFTGGTIEVGKGNDTIQFESIVDYDIGTIITKGGMADLVFTEGVTTGANIDLNLPGNQGVFLAESPAYDLGGTLTNLRSKFDMNGGKISTTEQNDEVHLGEFFGGSIYTHGGDDYVYVDYLTDGMLDYEDGEFLHPHGTGERDEPTVIDTGAGDDHIEIYYSRSKAGLDENGDNTTGASRDITLLNSDIIRGGEGTDTLTLHLFTGARRDLWQADLANVTAEVEVFHIPTIWDATVYGTNEADEIVTSFVSPSDFADPYSGELFGNDGDDLLTVLEAEASEGDGLSTVHGGNGNDTINITTIGEGHSTAVKVNGGEGADRINIDLNGGDSIITSINNFNMSEGDTLFIDGTDVTEDINSSQHIWGDITVNFIGNIINYNTDAVYDLTDNLGRGAITIDAHSFSQTITLIGDNGFDVVGTRKFQTIYISSGGRINGSAGDDNFTVSTVYNGSIYGGAGNDKLYQINPYDAGSVYMSGSQLHGESGDDYFSIVQMDSGNIDGGEGNDTIEVDTMDYGTIDGGNGEDTIKINYVYDNDKVFGGGDNDLIEIDKQMADEYGIESISIDGGEGNDTIKMGEVLQGSLVGGHGDDLIEITLASNETSFLQFVGGEGNDTIKFTELSGEIDIYGGTGDDSIHIETTSQHTGIIEGGEGRDTYNINGDGTSVKIKSFNKVDDTLIIKGQDVTSELTSDTTYNWGDVTIYFTY